MFGCIGDTSAPFPPPWSVDEPEVCFIVRTPTDRPLAYVFFEEELEHRSGGASPHPRRG